MAYEDQYLIRRSPQSLEVPTSQERTGSRQSRQGSAKSKKNVETPLDPEIDDLLVFHESAFDLSKGNRIYIYEGSPKLDDLELTELIMDLINEDLVKQQKIQKQALIEK